MSVSFVTPVEELYGLYEISPQGKVLYYQSREKNEHINDYSEFIGKSFFGELLSFINIDEFREKIENFWNCYDIVHTFIFNALVSKGEIPLKVILLRVNRPKKNNPEKFIILEIRECKLF